MKEKSSGRRFVTPEQKAYIKEHFHNTPDPELADALGLSVYTIRVYRTKFGLRKDAEYMHSLNRKKAIEYNNADRINTPEAYVKRVKTMAELRKKEITRMKWGLIQKTKLHIRMEPRGKLLQRNRLQRLGYIIDEKTLTAYYTPSTYRATRLEAIPRGTTKGSIHSYYEFRPYDEQRLD